MFNSLTDFCKDPIHSFQMLQLLKVLSEGVYGVKLQVGQNLNCELEKAVYRCIQ